MKKLSIIITLFALSGCSDQLEDILPERNGADQQLYCEDGLLWRGDQGAPAWPVDSDYHGICEGSAS